MPRPQAMALLALLALACASPAARAASDCSSVPGCTACSYELNKKSELLLNCKACAAPAYTLNDKNACDCAAGFFSRLANGTKTGSCAPVAPGSVAAAGSLGAATNTQRTCGNNSVPDAALARCLCAAGFYAQVGGQVPRCGACTGATAYTDEPNTRGACKGCPLGHVADATNTGCVALADAIANATKAFVNVSAAGAVNATLSQLRERYGSLQDDVNLVLANVSARANDTLQSVNIFINGSIHNISAALNPVAALRRALNGTAFERGASSAAASNATASSAVNTTRLDALVARLNLNDSKALARVFNASGQVSNLQGLWSDVRSAGVPLPAVNATSIWHALTPNLSIPGLEGGASNGVDALVKIAKAAWANKELRSFILAQLPVILGVVVKLAAASG